MLGSDVATGDLRERSARPAEVDGVGPEDVPARLRGICDSLDIELLRPAGHSLRFMAESDVVGLVVRPVLARCLALIVTELVVNAAEHAFAGREAGRLMVSLGRTRDHLVCTVRDDGAGTAPIAGRGRSQGLVRAERLAAEAGGSCRWLFTAGGTLAEAALPLTSPNAALSSGR